MATATVSRATIIWQQISLATKMACGAREPVGSDEGYLHFRVTIKPRRFNKIIVRLTAADLYDVELVEINRRDWSSRIVESVEGIYADDLSETIYRFCNK